MGQTMANYLPLASVLAKGAAFVQRRCSELEYGAWKLQFSWRREDFIGMAMFENLSKRLEGIFENLSGQGKLTEEDVNAALREVRMALVEADVNFKVARQFVERVKEKAIGADVMGSLSPAQQVLSIVNEELVEVLGGTDGKNKLDLGGTPPNVIMLVGLQGSGKTTTAAKLANFLRKQGQRPLLVAADMYRPAAVNQLKTLGKQLNVPVYSEPTGADPVNICVNSLAYAREQT